MKIKKIIGARLSKKMAIVVASIIAISLIASGAGLLSSYGEIETKTKVSQSVKIDGHNWNQPIKRNYELSGGCCKCETHTITNDACVEAPIDITTDIDGHGKGIDGVHVNYFIFNDLTDTRNMGQYWPGLEELDGELEVSIEYGCEETTFTAKAPSDYAWDDLMTFAFDMNCDGTADFQIQWDEEWKYKEVVSGTWGNWEDVPEQYVLTKSGRTHTLTLPNSELGTKYKFGVDSNSLNNEGSQCFYSTDPAHLWYNGVDYISSDKYVTLTVKGDVPDELQPKSTVNFGIEYCFDVNIVPGKYDITTTIVPGTN